MSRESVPGYDYSRGMYISPIADHACSIF
jgi:hypothetical protein